MTNTPDHLAAATEAEFAQALDQAIATGVPVQAPIEVLRAFGLDVEHGPDSAEAADVAGRPWLDLVSGFPAHAGLAPRRGRNRPVTPRGSL